MVLYIEKKNDDTYFLHIVVRPNAKNQMIANDADYLIIYLRSKPIHNKANKELLNFLKKRLRIPANQITIISGVKSTDKIVKCAFKNTIDEEEILNRLLK